MAILVASADASGAKVFPMVRVLRLLRVFRVLRLGEYLQASELLWRSIVAGRRRIGVVRLTIITLVIIIGALMDVIEGPERGFRSIIAVPTGIVTAEIGQASARQREGSASTRLCPASKGEGHEADGRHCKHTGAML